MMGGRNYDGVSMHRQLYGKLWLKANVIEGDIWHNFIWSLS